MRVCGSCGKKWPCDGQFYKGGDRLILVHEDLLVQMAEAGNPEYTFTWDWGDPITEVVTYYTPTVTRHENVDKKHIPVGKTDTTGL
jgi:hypothetical protein